MFTDQFITLTVFESNEKSHDVYIDKNKINSFHETTNPEDDTNSPWITVYFDGGRFFNTPLTLKAFKNLLNGFKLS